MRLCLASSGTKEWASQVRRLRLHSPNRTTIWWVGFTAVHSLSCFFFVCLFLMPIVAAGKHFFKGVQWSCVQPQRVSVMTSRQKAGAPAGQCKMENTTCAWHIHVNIVKDLFYSRWPSSPFEILYKYISLYVCVLSSCVKSPIKMPQLWVSLTGSQFYSN